MVFYNENRPGREMSGLPGAATARQILRHCLMLFQPYSQEQELVAVTLADGGTAAGPAADTDNGPPGQESEGTVRSAKGMRTHTHTYIYICTYIYVYNIDVYIHI